MNQTQILNSMVPWADWYKEVNAQTGKKIALSGAERCRRYRARQTVQNAAKNLDSGDRNKGGKKHVGIDLEIQFSHCSPQQISSFPAPLEPSPSPDLPIEVLTPLSINKTFTFLRQRGYKIQGLQESYMLSSMAAVNENVNHYLPMFENLKPNSWDCRFPVFEFVFPGRVAYERYPLCFSRTKVDYQPVDDLIKTIKVLSTALIFESDMNLQTHIDCLELAMQERDDQIFLDTLKIINNIFGSVPPLVGPDTQCIVHLLQEIYGRCVKPKQEHLKGGQEETVYGELMPEFLERLFDETHLESDSLFVDLGSGAGNTVAQAALTRGCKAFGIELRSAVAAIADTMVKAAIIRSQIWGIPVGKINVVCGDMTCNAEVLEWIQAADLVLANNLKFPPSLNENVKNLIQFMKPGAILVSLESFGLCGVNRSGAVRSGADDVGLLFEVSTHQYFSGDVSWSNAGGEYYIHRKIA